MDMSRESVFIRYLIFIYVLFQTVMRSLCSMYIYICWSSKQKQILKQALGKHMLKPDLE